MAQHLHRSLSFGHTLVTTNSNIDSSVHNAHLRFDKKLSLSPTDSKANIQTLLNGADEFILDFQKLKCDDNSPTSTKFDKSALNPHDPPQSRVVHARAVPDGCNVQELHKSLSIYGNIRYITLMPKLRQSLLEFETLEAAKSCVTETHANQQYILGRPVFFNYSTSQEITRSPYGWDPTSGEPPSFPNQQSHIQPTHILLFTILNPLYPITVDILHTICSPCGSVQKIVIFNKNGIQALVEYDSVDSAKRSKEALDGADIYSGCCTLRIEYSKAERLNVYRNDRHTWDYTIDRTSAQLQNLTLTPAGQHLLASQGHISSNTNYGPHHISPRSTQDLAPPPNTLVQPNTVLMIYGLPESINCDDVYDLLFKYGQVLKIKVLTNKKGIAMAQMNTPTAAHKAISELNHQKYSGSTIELSFSKHHFIADPPSGYIAELPDETLAVKDYTLTTRKYRISPIQTMPKNNLVPSVKALQFCNSPLCAPNDTIITRAANHIRSN